MAKLTEIIDDKNNEFTSKVKGQLKDLEQFSDTELEWLMLEHFQFSVANPGFLMAAARTTEALAEKGVSAELERNYGEESGHAEIYRKGLAEIGTDTARRVEFRPTTEFLAKIDKLTVGDPSEALGALYATETAAIFEHEVFWAISKEICRRRGVPWDGSVIKGFHDMHLDGVEQSHKDELGVFVNPAGQDAPSQTGEPRDRAKVIKGADEAITAMKLWWRDLIGHVSPN